MIPAIIAGAAAIGSAVINGISARNARKASEREAEKQRKIIAQEKEEARKDYIREANTDITTRSDIANLLNKAGKQMERQASVDRARAVVSGGTAEATANQTARRGDQYSNMITNIAALGQRHKDNVLAQYQNRRASLSSQQSAQAGAMAQQHAIASNNAMGGVSSSLGTLGNILPDIIGSAKTKSTPTAKVQPAQFKNVGYNPNQFKNMIPSVKIKK